MYLLRGLFFVFVRTSMFLDGLNLLIILNRLVHCLLCAFFLSFWCNCSVFPILMIHYAFDFQRMSINYFLEFIIKNKIELFILCKNCKEKILGYNRIINSDLYDWQNLKYKKNIKKKLIKIILVSLFYFH
jgi:hypothetical protein